MTGRPSSVLPASVLSSRRRFIVGVGSVMMALALAYVVVAGVAPDVLAVKLAGSLALGWVAGCALLVATWLVCLAYVRRSDREWEPLAQRIVEEASAPSTESARFVRSGERERVR